MSGVTLHDFGETSCGKSRVMQPLMKGDGVTDPAAQESTLTLTLTLALALGLAPTRWHLGQRDALDRFAKTEQAYTVQPPQLELGVGVGLDRS